MWNVSILRSSWIARILSTKMVKEEVICQEPHVPDTIHFSHTWGSESEKLLSMASMFLSYYIRKLCFFSFLLVF